MKPFHRIMTTFTVVMMLLGITLPLQTAAQNDTHQDNEVTAIRNHDGEIAPGQLRNSTAQNLTIDEEGLSLVDGTVDGSVISLPIQAPIDFGAISLSWIPDAASDGGLRVEVRVGNDGRTWGGWNEVSGDETEAGDNGRVFGRLVYLDDTLYRWMQVRISLQRDDPLELLALRDVKYHLIDTSHGATSDELLNKINRLSQLQTSKPAIALRTDWGNPDKQSSPNWPPQYRATKHIIIHHTVNANTSSNWASVVRAIWSYHTSTLGWGDMGYNYLIDPNGVIYEGRAGGDNVTAGHTLDYNEGTMGVAFLGCFDSTACGSIGGVAPTAAALASARALLTWKANQQGLNLADSATDHRNRTYAVVSGHRDHGKTNCPGGMLYNQLSLLRTLVPPPVATCDPNKAYCAEYFANTTLSGTPVFTLAEPKIMRNWGWNGPGNGIPNDNFSVRWVGRRSFPTSNWWTFRLGADDGVRLWVDGRLIINSWIDTPYRMRSARIYLGAGIHEVKVEYYERGGTAAAQLCAAPNGQFCSDFFTNPSLTGNATANVWLGNLNENWGTGGPGNGIPNDNFSEQSYSRQYFDGRTYTLRACADDGVRVRLNGTLVINRWIDQPYTCKSTPIRPAAGWHDLTVEYYERGGAAARAVSWWPQRNRLNEQEENEPLIEETTPPSATSDRPYRSYLPLVRDGMVLPALPADVELLDHSEELPTLIPTTEPANPNELNEREPLPLPQPENGSIVGA